MHLPQDTPCPPRAVGIDFGTTNSSVALLRADGRVQMVGFPTAAGATRSSRSILYVQRKAASRMPSVWTGPEAIDRYLATDTFEEEVEGRLIQSLKSYLAARSFSGTEIFGRHYRVEDLLAKMLTDLRKRASASLGFDVTRAVAGRPVWFVSAETEADNQLAEDRLRTAYGMAGFTEVRFAMEPVAAAYAYAAELGSREEMVLIGDFGGGTTDFSLLRIAPGVRQVLGTTGVGLAGDAFDAKIVRYLVSPALGSESMARSLGKVLPALPAWVYSNLERWHTLSFLRTRQVMEMLRTTKLRALEPDRIEALMAVVQHDLGYRLHQAVQRLKIDLSAHSEAEFQLETDPVTLRTGVTRVQFEEWIAPELQRMETSLDSLLDGAGVQPAQVDRVFLTGGSSLVPAVQRVFTRRFGNERVTSGDAFTSVAHGLALMDS